MEFGKRELSAVGLVLLIIALSFIFEYYYGKKEEENRTLILVLIGLGIGALVLGIIILLLQYVPTFPEKVKEAGEKIGPTSRLQLYQYAKLKLGKSDKEANEYASKEVAKNERLLTESLR